MLQVNKVIANFSLIIRILFCWGEESHPTDTNIIL